MGSRLHVNGSILDAFFPKVMVFILVLGDEQDSNDIEKWDARHTTYTGQEVLHLVEDLCGRGSIKGHGGILRLLVYIGSPTIVNQHMRAQHVKVQASQ